MVVFAVILAVIVYIALDMGNGEVGEVSGGLSEGADLLAVLIEYLISISVEPVVALFGFFAPFQERFDICSGALISATSFWPGWTTPVFTSLPTQFSE